MKTFVNFTRMFLRAEVEFWGAAMKAKLLEEETDICPKDFIFRL